jgi:hypothetical protein
MSRCALAACERIALSVTVLMAFTQCVNPESIGGETTASHTQTVMLSPSNTLRWFFPQGGRTSGANAEDRPDHHSFQTFYHFVNTHADPVEVEARFQGPAGTWTQTFVVPGNRRTTRAFSDFTGNLGFYAAEFHSRNPGREIQVSSTIFNDGFDEPFWKTSTAVNGATEARMQWYFGEGGAYAHLAPGTPVFDNVFAVYNPQDHWVQAQPFFYPEDPAHSIVAGEARWIPPRSRLEFQPFPGFNEALAIQVRSAIVNCTSPCIAQLTMYQRRNVGVRKTNTQSAFGSQIAHDWYIVGIPSSDAWHPRMYFFNPGGQSTPLRLTYRNAAGSPLHEWTYNLPANRRISYDLREIHLAIGSQVVNRGGDDLSLEIHADLPIALTKILYWPYGGHLWGEGATTTGHSKGGNRVVFPGGHGGGGHNNYIQIRNLETFAVTVTVTAYRTTNIPIEHSLVIPASGMRQIDASIYGEIGDFATRLVATGRIIAESANNFGWTGGPLLWHAGESVEGIVYEPGNTFPTQP